MIRLPEIKTAELSTYGNFAKCHQALFRVPHEGLGTRLREVYQHSCHHVDSLPWSYHAKPVNQLDFVSVRIRPSSDDDFEEHMAVIASKLSYTKCYNHFAAS